MYRAGDLIGFSSCSSVGITINLFTWGIPCWGLSHVGVVVENPWFTELLMYESTSLADGPCVIQEKMVYGVQAHSVFDRVEKYDGKVWHYPLQRPLTPEQKHLLLFYVERYLGYSYDRIGAFRSRSLGFGWLEKRLRKEDLQSIFCSEFVAAAWRYCDVFRTGNVSKWNPNALARAALRRGVVCEPVRVK